MPSLTTSKVERRRVQRAAMNSIKPAEERYVKVLREISRAWAKAYMRELQPVIAARFDAKTDKLPGSFDVLGIRVDVAIERNVGGLFDTMARDVVKATGRTQAVFGITPKSSGLVDIIAERRSANIDLLKKAHGSFRDQVRELLEDPANFGMRSETLAKRLAERSDVSEERAELIARDQTLTLNGQITEARQTSAGVEKYTWSTSLDERVRDEHAALEGQVIDWDDPPEVGHPGEDVLCRCVAIPVVEELEGVFDEPAEATKTATPAAEAAAEDPVPDAPLVEGRHVGSVDSELSSEATADLLGSIDDEGTINFLERHPLGKIVVQRQVQLDGADVGGIYNSRTKELHVSGARKSEYIGRGLHPGESQTLASAADTKADAAKTTLRHELGHHVHRVDGNGSKVDTIVHEAFVRAIKADVFITQYAGSQAVEYFAESYAAYHLHPRVLSAHDPNGYAMVEEVLRLRGIK